ncbi:DNA repair protein rad50 [Entophlyctis luteolus]|nr:DNA repair protein rad50 [Entophlyctis luteolus]
MPPNSAKSFVHDPRVAHESEVKGQVKLTFRNVNGKRMVATRSLVMSLTRTSASTKTLESVLATYVNENDRAVTSSFLRLFIGSHQV